MLAPQDKTEGNYFWRYDPCCFKDASALIFDSTYWKEKNAIIGQENGRGTTWFIKHNEHELVFRHYLRGGIIRHISHDRYLFNGYQNTRAVAEFDILNLLLKKSLPVPTPAAAQVVKHGLFYEADLLTHKIPDAQDLVKILQQPQDEAFYQQLGRLIATFHQEGVFHADLNIQNILQDKHGQFWLIDFDRARILPPQQKWQERTLARLKRSFEKEQQRFGIKWTEKDWASLMQGYNK